MILYQTETYGRKTNKLEKRGGDSDRFTGADMCRPISLVQVLLFICVLCCAVYCVFLCVISLNVDAMKEEEEKQKEELNESWRREKEEEEAQGELSVSVFPKGG